MRMIQMIFLNFLFLVIPALSYGQTMHVQGHRGNRGLRPENSLPAFATAIEAGADVLELDLLVSKDGKLIIHHDYTVNQKLCTYLDGTPVSNPALIRSLTLSEIKQLDCGRKKRSRISKTISNPRHTNSHSCRTLSAHSKFFSSQCQKNSIKSRDQTRSYSSRIYYRSPRIR